MLCSPVVNARCRGALAILVGSVGSVARCPVTTRQTPYGKPGIAKLIFVLSAIPLYCLLLVVNHGHISRPEIASSSRPLRPPTKQAVVEQSISTLSLIRVPSRCHEYQHAARFAYCSATSRIISTTCVCCTMQQEAVLQDWAQQQPLGSPETAASCCHTTSRPAERCG